MVFEIRVQDGLYGIDLRVGENRFFKKLQQEKWESNQGRYTENVKKTDERNIVDIESICFGDWIELEMKRQERKKSMIGLVL